MTGTTDYPFTVKGTSGGGLIFGDGLGGSPAFGAIWGALTSTGTALTPSSTNYSIGIGPLGNLSLNVPTGGYGIDMAIGGSQKLGMTVNGGMYLGNAFYNLGNNTTLPAGDMVIQNDLGIGLGLTGSAGSAPIVPSANLHLGGGTATAGTAPLKINSGTLLATTEAGAIENNGTHLYYTPVAAGTRYQLDQQSSGSGTVTSVGTGLGLTGGTITSSGTVSLDTTSSVVLSRQRAANTYQTKFSGTAGYLPYFATSSTLGNSPAYTNGTNIGVGTTTLNHKLNLNGSINIPQDSTYYYNGLPVIQAQTSLYNYYFGGAGNLTGTGSYNSASAPSSLGKVTNGSFNSSSGTSSLYWLTTGMANTANGFGAGAVYGYGTGLSLTNPDSSTFIGYHSAALTDNDVNETVIGANTVGNGSHTVTIGNITNLRTYLTGVNLKASPGTAGTAPLKINSGTLLSTTEAGAIENNGTHLYYTPVSSGTRYQLDQQSSGSGTVTSVATGLGLTGGTITSSGTVSLDTTSSVVLSRQRAANEYLKSITSTLVTNALGFTPYNSTNPSAYIPLTALSGTSPIIYTNTTGVISHSTADGNLHVPATGTTNNGKFLMAGATAGSLSWGTPSASMVYPGVGIAVSTGSAWGTSLTDNSTNWNSAYTDRLKWDGGSTGLTAATGRTSLGGTTVGQNFFTATNPSAITFPRVNADNSLSLLSASAFLTAIGGSSGGSVTSITMGDGLASTQSPLTTSGTMKVDTSQTMILSRQRAANTYALKGSVSGPSNHQQVYNASTITLPFTGTTYSYLGPYTITYTPAGSHALIMFSATVGVNSFSQTGSIALYVGSVTPTYVQNMYFNLYAGYAPMSFQTLQSVTAGTSTTYSIYWYGSSTGNSINHGTFTIIDLP